MLVISSSCSVQVWSSRRPLLLQWPAPYSPTTPSQETTLALKSPRMMSLSAGVYGVTWWGSTSGCGVAMSFSGQLVHL